MSKKERALGVEVKEALSRQGCVLFVNVVAKAWVGKLVSTVGDKVILIRARRVFAGLCVGSADLIGWTGDGRFLAVELKTGRVPSTEAQRNFIHRVNEAGGIGFIARSADEAVAKYIEATKRGADR